MYYPIFAPDGTEIYPIAPSGYESRWRCQESTYHNLVKEHRIEWKKDKKCWKVYQKFYLEGRTKQPGNLWVGIEGNKKATITLKNVLGNNVFSFPKPIELISRIIQIATNNDSIILDFLLVAVLQDTQFYNTMQKVQTVIVVLFYVPITRITSAVKLHTSVSSV